MRSWPLIGLCLAAFFCACDPYYKDDYRDNSPTSGKLRVCYDEGLELHVRNQAYTFHSQYERADLELVEKPEAECYRLLLADSCEAIVVSRLPDKGEQQLFTSKKYTPKYSHVAWSGIAIVAPINSPIREVDPDDFAGALNGAGFPDSSGNTVACRIIIDKNNSSVMRYLLDSVGKRTTFGSNCSSLSGSIKTLEYVASHPGTIGVLDYAWLSDRDDSLFRAFSGKLKILGVKNKKGMVAFPSQSAFKTGDYPYARKVYVLRKTGEFSLAKGFESFVAGPKGQLIFLKQGLLPARQAERTIHVNLEPLETSE